MSKTWYTSKAVWGAIFLGVAGVAEALGVAIPEVVFTLAEYTVFEMLSNNKIDL
jgi:hypothetical protein